MKSKHFLALLTAAALCTAIPATNSTMISHADAAEEPVKIMAVGDSITDGYWEQGAYRKYLYRDLNANGITNIDMVGPKGSNEEQYDSFSYDGNYAGYSGYAIQYITGTETRQGIYETLKDGNLLETYQPDLVLLQIGTNDILSAYNDGIADRLEHLVDYIASYLPEDGRLFVASIPDIDVATVYSWFWAYGSEYYGVDPAVFAEKIQTYIDTYNASIQQLVAAKQSAGMSIQFCDINAVVDLTTDLYDGVHPNEAGYENMGKCWAETLTAYFNGSDVPPVSTTTTAATTTTTTTTSARADINRADHNGNNDYNRDNNRIHQHHSNHNTCCQHNFYYIHNSRTAALLRRHQLRRQHFPGRCRSAPALFARGLLASR